MNRIFKDFRILVILMALVSCKDNKAEKTVEASQNKTSYYIEPYRPQFHFSPEENWMNDPNGMVYHEGVYHLFYQYYPEDIVWGPMHWGHAVSKDLVHWQHKPIALYPDENGLIFSGSAVVDSKNTSGFGSLENPPLVAIYTYHLMAGEKAGRKDFQTQGIAYSLDNGDSWSKFEGNPVIGNEGIKDFRDPKVMWHEPSEKWIMTLVAGDHAKFYSSSNLKDWKLTGEFGKDRGAHGGVWECPDLFKINVDGSDEQKWVLLISTNPGAPNGGSGTQYFVGDFDGSTFLTDQEEPKWLDYGTDNYAGVTYNNAPDGERIFIGWMSNWAYALVTPTEKWRSAMTLPRKLRVNKRDNSYSLMNYPIKNMETLIADSAFKDVIVDSEKREVLVHENLNQSEIQFYVASENFQLKLSNTLGEELILTMLGNEKQFFLDRTNSGKVDFQDDFASIQMMPVPDLPDDEYEVRLLVDTSSIEVFINKGQYVMTAQLFPNEKYTNLTFENMGDEEMRLKKVSINTIKRIW